jgi:hypothetical protein
VNRAGATIPVKSKKACVTYDSSNGRIHHHHYVLTLVGGREPTEDEIAVDAIRIVAKRRNPPGGELRVLHVHHEALEPGKQYRVDLHKKTLAVVK